MSGEYQNGVFVAANYLKNRVGQAITISGDATIHAVFARPRVLLRHRSLNTGLKIRYMLFF